MGILKDVEKEAVRLIETAQREGIILRLLGGLAIKIHSPKGASHPALARSYADMDFVTDRKSARYLEKFLSGQGYTPDIRFNTLNGDRRQLYFDEAHDRQIDIFVGTFDMCHEIPVSSRLNLEPYTLPLAELFLTKAQIVELNRKDIQDLYALLLEHPVGNSDDDTVNAARIAELCARDWGLYKTISINIDKLRDFMGEFDLSRQDKETIASRLDAIQKAMDEAPKSLSWKMRAKIGTKVRWYKLPEEVRR